MSIFKVARFIHAAHVDLIHTNSLKADIIGGLAGRLCGKPVVWHVRDRIDEDYLPLSVVWTFRFLCKFVPSWVIANSGATLNTLRRRSRGSAAIPSGVDVDMLAPAEMGIRGQELFRGRAGVRVVHDGTISSPALLKAPALPAPPAIELTPGIATGEPRITLVGRVARWKGQHIFLQAAAWTLRRFPKARFEIVGAPLFDERDYEEEIHALARRLGIENSVAFLGFRSDIPQYLAGIDLLVHASITGEPFGQVIIEAMAAGKPVVATNGGGVPEIVEHGESGLLVPMGDAGAMAEAICRILEDPAAAAEMGQRGRQCVAERFTVDHTASKVQSVYDDLLDARR
jgi:glycosyltransferase involved in cell wall biosynthesis